MGKSKSIHSSPLTGGETEAQRRAGVCPKSQSRLMAELVSLSSSYVPSTFMLSFSIRIPFLHLGICLSAASHFGHSQGQTFASQVPIAKNMSTWPGLSQLYPHIQDLDSRTRLPIWHPWSFLL